MLNADGSTLGTVVVSVHANGLNTNLCCPGSSCVSQIHTTLKDTAGIKMTSILRDKILQLHMVLARALAIVVQHGSFESKFLHAQWDREMTVSLRHLWKFHIELLLAVRLQVGSESTIGAVASADIWRLGKWLIQLICECQ